jgi:seipin
MESSDPNTEDDDVYFDALDDFPFYDCLSSLTAEPERYSSSLTFSAPNPSPETPSASTLRRRHFSRRVLSRKVSNDSSLDLDLDSDSTLSFEILAEPDTKPSFRQRKYGIDRNANQKPDPESTQERVTLVSPAQGSNSTITTVTDIRVDDNSAESAAGFSDPSFNLLVFVAGLVIKAINFQINLFITFITFPLLLLYHSYALITNPFQTVRRGRDHLIQRLSKLGDIVRESASPWLNDWSREHSWVLKVVLRCAWGLLWSVYVCVVLCGLLVSSVAVSGILMRYLVEEPIQMKEVLIFDYTKHSPVTYVPVASCGCVGCGEDCEEKISGFRVVPPGHRLQATVSLTLPESEYNRNLGVFQVLD